MSEVNNEPGFVEALRLKTEETDLNHYLKRALGGYTKQSVLDYLNALRKQQQIMADTFSSNQQALFEEKETLKKANSELTSRLGQAESEARRLNQIIQDAQWDGEHSSVADIATLSSKITVLEDERCAKESEISALKQKNSLQTDTIQDLEKRLEQTEGEKQGFFEMIRAEKLQTKKQMETVNRLTAAVEGKEVEINYLKAQMSEGTLAELRGKVNELTEQLTAQTEIMATCNQENVQKAKTVELLRQEKEMLQGNIVNLTKAVAEGNDQNAKILLENDVLTEQLEGEYKRAILLMKEKSALIVEKLTAIRELDEEKSRNMLLGLTGGPEKAESEDFFITA